MSKDDLTIAYMCGFEDGKKTVLGDGWRDVKKELPENSNNVLGAWKEKCGDNELWNYAVVKYNKFNQYEWIKDAELIKVEYWRLIYPPALT